MKPKNEKQLIYDDLSGKFRKVEKSKLDFDWKSNPKGCVKFNRRKTKSGYTWDYVHYGDSEEEICNNYNEYYYKLSKESLHTAILHLGRCINPSIDGAAKVKDVLAALSVMHLDDEINFSDLEKILTDSKKLCK